jgi:hypothetical protein
MSGEFDGLDATEKAAIGAALNRCRVIAAKIANELRNKRPEYFVDKSLLADIHSSLEHAADVLSTLPMAAIFVASMTNVDLPRGGVAVRAGDVDGLLSCRGDFQTPVTFRLWPSPAIALTASFCNFSVNTLSCSFAPSTWSRSMQT